YLAPDLVDRIAAAPGRLALGGELREMTFLFTDLEDFTALGERLPPETLVRVLNAYLDALSTIVMNHGGAIDKIVGDAIHAMFNAPVETPDHAERAVRCALALDAYATAYADRLRQEGVAFGRTRIGVNTGEAVVGNFGGARRFDYTAHGDAINTAARLEAANKTLGTCICVSAATARVAPTVRFRPIGKVTLKGKANAVDCLEPLAEGRFPEEDFAIHREAWGLLNDGDDRAADLFDALVRAHPDDRLLRRQSDLSQEGAAARRRVAAAR
ncbi:MAG: adenylate/guanylate cyclase domain-containing protein, partial [Alphaproteobacteria bacterium]